MASVRDFVARLVGRKPSFDHLPDVWDSGRPAIHDFLASFPSERPLPPEAQTLPDEATFYEGKGALRWASGAADGVFSHHSGDGNDQVAASTLVDFILRACRAPTKGHLARLHETLLSAEPLSVADPLATELTKSGAEPARVFAIAHWLATRSPDRNPVKLGIVLLGLIEEAPLEVLATLGRHDEFTLYAAVALERTVPEADRDQVLWRLARDVTGWGRIHLVERLAETEDAQIKAWLVREGFRNSIMDQYLACICARAGNLKGELLVEKPDTALLRAAGDIILALVERGGPTEDISAYEHGAAVLALYLDHLLRRAPSTVDDLVVAGEIASYCSGIDNDWAQRPGGGWDADGRAALVGKARAVMAQDGWRALVEQGLADSDRHAFSIAARAAPSLAIDPWEARFERQSRGIDEQWFELMRSQDRLRIARVVALAERNIDLKAVATGAGMELGLGPQFAHHRALDFVLQDLSSFAGLGWPLIAAALQSPTVRNRNMAVRVLGKWGQAHWPAEAREALVAAVAVEPDDDVRARMRVALQDLPA